MDDGIVVEHYTFQMEELMLSETYLPITMGLQEKQSIAMAGGLHKWRTTLISPQTLLLKEEQ